MCGAEKHSASPISVILTPTEVDLLKLHSVWCICIGVVLADHKENVYFNNLTLDFNLTLDCNVKYMKKTTSFNLLAHYLIMLINYEYNQLMELVFRVKLLWFKYKIPL